MKKKSIGSPASLQFLQQQQSSFAHKSRPQLSPKHETSINIQDPKTLEMDLLTTPKIHSKATPVTQPTQNFSKCPCQMSYLPKHMPWYFFSTIDLDWHETSSPIHPPETLPSDFTVGRPELRREEPETIPPSSKIGSITLPWHIMDDFFGKPF